MSRVIGGNGVGRIHIEVEVSNYEDVSRARRGLLAPDKVRRLIVPAVVDSGAARLVVPQFVVKRLDLQPSCKIEVTYADGRRATRDQVDGVSLEILGRRGFYSAVVEPRRRSALLGVIVLEDLDLLIDPKNERLVPRDPRGPIYEIE